MRLLVAGMIANVLAFGACKSRFERYCDSQTPCTDPEFPYCDITGEFAASEGHGNVCIPSPIDAGLAADASMNPSPETPSPLSPRNGATTGSVLRADRSARPVFRWNPSTLASTYDLAVDDSCSALDFATCAFSTPEIDVTGLAETIYQPPTSLPVNVEVPVGTRYFWRIRACNDMGCSGWSSVRYVDVGRQSNDYNGDGFADRIVATAPSAGALDQVGRVYVYFGASDLAGTLSTADAEIADPRSVSGGGFGASVASAGDINADGFADLVIGAPGHDGGAGAAFLYHGRAVWPDTVMSPTTEIEFVDPEIAGFGSTTAGGGDINGDGFADVAVAAPVFMKPSPNVSRAFAYFGRPNAPAFITTADVVFEKPVDGSAFAWDIAIQGDLNGDGWSDVVVGYPFAEDGGQETGAALVYFGAEDWASPRTAPDATILPGFPQGAFGFAVETGGDLNDDGFDDIAIAAPLRANPELLEGNVFLVFGNPALSGSSGPDVEVDHPGDRQLAQFGMALDSGDVNGDSVADLVVGGPTGDDDGEVFAFYGATSWPGLVQLASVSFASPAPSSTATVGSAISASGDLNGDGLEDITAGAPLVQDAELDEGKAYVWFGDETWGFTGPGPSITIDNPSPAADSRFGNVVE